MTQNLEDKNDSSFETEKNINTYNTNTSNIHVGVTLSSKIEVENIDSTCEYESLKKNECEPVPLDDITSINNYTLKAPGITSSDTMAQNVFKRFSDVLKSDENETDQMLTEAKSKRSNRRQRYQRAFNKKWRQVEPVEMGFQISSFLNSMPVHPDTFVSEKIKDVSILPNNISGIDDSCASEAVNQRNRKCDIQDDSGEALSIDDLDDETYFSHLGIDINDSGEDKCDNNILLCDRVCTLHKKKTLTQQTLNMKTQTTEINDNDKLVNIPSSTKIPKIKATSNDTITFGKHKNKHQKTYIASSSEITNNTSNLSKSDIGLLFDFSCKSSSKIYLRPDRNRRSMKSHKAVKSKHALRDELFNNPKKKKLYMHHRLIKLHNIHIDYLIAYQHRSRQQIRMPQGVDIEWIKGIRLKVKSSECKKNPRGEKPQNLSHVLHETNVPVDIEMDLISFLLSVQNRELTPEDYDMLLRLDESVKAKTVNTSLLDSLRTEAIGEENLSHSICTICMEPYIVGQVRKFLPCDHDFHNECINTWLNNSSQNCPLDGLPIL